MFSKTNAIFDDDGSRAWSSVVHKHRIDQRLLSPFNSLSLGVQIKKKPAGFTCCFQIFEYLKYLKYLQYNILEVNSSVRGEHTYTVLRQFFIESPKIKMSDNC